MKDYSKIKTVNYNLIDNPILCDKWFNQIPQTVFELFLWWCNFVIMNINNGILHHYIYVNQSISSWTKVKSTSWYINRSIYIKRVFSTILLLYYLIICIILFSPLFSYCFISLSDDILPGLVLEYLLFCCEFCSLKK